MDLSLLLLTTPMMPATPPAPGVLLPPGPVVENVDPGDPGETGVVPPVVVPPVVVPPRPAADEVPPRPDVVFVDGCEFSWPGPLTTRSWSVPGTTCPAPSGWKSSFVMGSLNFFRRNRCSYRVSMFGGYAFMYFRWNKPIACTYCVPRKISSSSFSRWAICFQTGIAADSITAITPIATRSTAIAYPDSLWRAFLA